MAIVGIIQNLISDKMRVALVGDFNTLNPLDSKRYQDAGLLNFYKRQDNPVFKHFRDKYCFDNASGTTSSSQLTPRLSQHDKYLKTVTDYKLIPISNSTNNSTNSSERGLLSAVDDGGYSRSSEDACGCQERAAAVANESKRR